MVPIVNVCAGRQSRIDLLNPVHNDGLRRGLAEAVQSQWFVASLGIKLSKLSTELKVYNHCSQQTASPLETAAITLGHLITHDQQLPVVVAEWD